MAQIECDYCTKTFKSETGYHWHLDHLQSTEKVAFADTEVSEPIGEEDLMGEILASLDEFSEFQRQMSEEMAQLSGGLEHVKGAKVSTGSLKKEIAHVKTLVGSIGHRLSWTDRVSDALACLVLELDTRLKPKEFRVPGDFLRVSIWSSLVIAAPQ